MYLFTPGLFHRLQPPHLFLTIRWLSPAEADPYFTVKLHDKTGVEKDEIILKCQVSKDVPVKWFKDGEEIVPSPKHSVKTDGLRRILKIKKAELKDKGEYVCDCGTDTTKANVTVEGELPPSLDHPISEIQCIRLSPTHRTLRAFSSTHKSGKAPVRCGGVCGRNRPL